MNSFILLALAVLPFVHCAVDPTTICMPEKFSADIYDSKRVVTGFASVDYTSNRAGSVYEDGIRRVVDLKTDTLYSITPDSKCTKSPYPAEQRQQLERCLPANAVQPGANIALGLPDNRVVLQYWSVDEGNGASVMAAYTTGTPAIPVLRQQLKNGVDEGMFIFANPRTESNATLLAIPFICPDAVIF